MNDDVELKMKVIFLNDMLLEVIGLLGKKGFISRDEIKKVRMRLHKRAITEYNLPPHRRRHIEHPPIYNGMIGELDIINKGI